MIAEYTINPTHSIGPILLGMTRLEVIEIMGEPEYTEAAHERWGIQFPDKDCFVDACIQVRYIDNKVDDIQIAKHPNFICTLKGVPIHDSTVEEVSRVAEGICPIDKEDTEFPFTYSYPRIGLTFWKEDADNPHFDTVNLAKPKSEQSASCNPLPAAEFR